MSKKLVIFFAVDDREGVIDLSAIHQGVTHSFEKFAFVIANKDDSECWAERRTHSHTIKSPVHDIIKTEFNRKCSHVHQFSKHCA